MKKIRLKKGAIYGVSAFVIALLVGALYFVDYSNSKLQPKEDNDDMQYVTRLFGEEDIPVVASEDIIMRPYTDANVKIVKNFYNYKGDEKSQEESIINYEETYIQNSGVAYGGIDSDFDVTASLSGTVTSIKEDKLLGNIVEIKNSDKIITIYQGLSVVNVKQDDKVNQGDIIGKSGETNINKDLGSHMIFELKINDQFVDPEEYYDKKTNELE